MELEDNGCLHFSAALVTGKQDLTIGLVWENQQKQTGLSMDSHVTFLEKIVTE